MPDSLAVRLANVTPISEPRTSTSIVRVSQILEGLTSRDPNGEILTTLRHYPAREAQWADFPSWVHKNPATVFSPGWRRRSDP